MKVCNLLWVHLQINHMLMLIVNYFFPYKCWLVLGLGFKTQLVNFKVGQYPLQEPTWWC